MRPRIESSAGVVTLHECHGGGQIMRDAKDSDAESVGEINETDWDAARIMSTKGPRYVAASNSKATCWASEDVGLAKADLHNRALNSRIIKSALSKHALSARLSKLWRSRRRPRTCESG